jgi:hypothetical protein
MIRKCVQRFSEKIMLKQEAKARWRSNLMHRALEHARFAVLPGRNPDQAFMPT